MGFRTRSSLSCHWEKKLTYEVDRISELLYGTIGVVTERNKRAPFSKKFERVCRPYWLVEIHKAHKHARGPKEPCFLLKFAGKGIPTN